MIPISDTIISIKLPLVLAQASGVMEQILSALGQDLGASLLTLGQAILILLLGWIVAAIAKRFTKKILEQTNIDNQIAAWIGGGDRGESLPVETWISEIVYWLIILFAVVAFLNMLQLEAVSAPLNTLLEHITGFIPQVAGAGILLGIAWLLATLTKLAIVKSLQALRLDERLGQGIGETSEDNQLVLSETVGNAIYWFIFLLFLPSILSTLQLEGTLVPIQQLLNEILAILPNILAAVLIGAVGWLVAQVIRRIVTNIAAVSGINQVGEKFGLSSGQGRQSLSQILGSVVYVLVLIPITITALDALQIQAISVPATEMLNQVLNLLPKLFSASVILILAYIAGQYVSELVTNILTGIGFNNIFQWLGIATPTSLAEVKLAEEEDSAKTPTRTASEIVGIIVSIAIMLVASLTAVDILKIEALKTVVGVILVIGGQVLVGLVVFAVGLYLANIAFNLITSSGTRQAKFLGNTARIAIIILVSAMALQQMGIAPNIVNLAFGLITGGISVAIALAFGLGGREVAAEQLREWLDSFKQE